MFETFCHECNRPGDRWTKGDGKCRKCQGTGTEGSIWEAIPKVGAKDCRACGGSGICPRCHGQGMHD